MLPVPFSTVHVSQIVISQLQQTANECPEETRLLVDSFRQTVPITALSTGFTWALVLSVWFGWSHVDICITPLVDKKTCRALLLVNTDVCMRCIYFSAFLRPDVGALKSSFLHSKNRKSLSVQEETCRIRKLIKFRPPICVADTFPNAVRKGFVKDFGRFVYLDEHGHFPLSNELQVTHSISAKLNKIVGLILKVLGKGNVRAIYVRGSVASGVYEATRGSDLDLIIIVESELPQSQRLDVNRVVSDVSKSELGLSGADICIVSKGDALLCSQNASSHLRNTLRNYSILLYGSKAGLGLDSRLEQPGDTMALDIRKAERFFLLPFDDGGPKNAFELQAHAIRWLCKRSLRAIADLSANRTLRHSRDLVPCYFLGSEAFPMYEGVMLQALQFACGSAENDYLDLSRREFLLRGFTVARNIVEVVEELCLSRNFDEKGTLSAIETGQVSPEVRPNSAILQGLTERVEQGMAGLIGRLSRSYDCLCMATFHRAKFPDIALEASYSVEEAAFTDSRVLRDQRSLVKYLIKLSKPIIFRRVFDGTDTESDKKASEFVRDFLFRYTAVQCRLSPSNEFTFCRSSHDWISRERFTPPSKLVTLSAFDALTRMRTDHTLSALEYTKSPREHVYIQTATRRGQRLFKGIESSNVRLAQNERDRKSVV